MTEREVFKTLCENSLEFFALQYMKVLEPETDFINNWHIKVICDHLEAVYDGHTRSLNINIPPRTIKSVLVNVIFPCWIWTKQPSYKVGSCSHSSGLSTSFNMKRRKVIKSEEFQALWPIDLKSDADTQKYFENEQNGFFASLSVGGSVTGMGFDLIITDDLLNAEDAHSEVKREYANNWYASTLYNRLQDKRTGKRINVMQRLHNRDLTGFIKETYTFEHLVIPMQKEEGQVETSLGWKDPREVGEFIHPERYNQAEKDDEFRGLGSYGWAGQMQQRPSPVAGGIIKRDWLNYFDKLPDKRLTRAIQAWDLTFKKTGTSYVVGQVWYQYQDEFYLVHQVRRKMSFTETMTSIKSMSKAYPKASVKLIEDKANGPAILDSLRTEVSGLRPYSPKTSSKEERLYSVQNLFEFGKVFIPNKEWIKDYVDELVTFPTASYDDQVDATSMALIFLGAKKAPSFYNNIKDDDGDLRPIT